MTHDRYRLQPDAFLAAVDALHAAGHPLADNDPPPEAKPSPVAVTPWAVKLVAMVLSAVATVAALAVPFGGLLVIHATVTVQIGGGL